MDSKYSASASSRKVTVSELNTAINAPFNRSVPMVMNAVKIVQASRYVPTPLCASPLAAASNAAWVSRYQNDSQNAP